MTEMKTIDLVKARLTTALNPTHLEILDQSREHAGHRAADGAAHFSITVVSLQFVGLTLVQRHRLVYNALGDLMNTAIHALSIQAQTPE